MRFTILGSGSKGNATLVEHGNTRVLIDCGFSVVEMERRLARVACSAHGIDALLLTHEHGDHVRGAGAFSRKYGIPVYLTHGTGRALGGCDAKSLCYISSDARFAVKDIEVQAFAVPHDANEPCQYVLSDGASRIGMLSDTGKLTPHVVAQLHGCEALLLESNHDLDMLLASAYPASLKRRISGGFGHLNNDQAGDLLRQLDCSRLSHIVAIHLSESNNHPDHVTAGFSAALDCTADWVAVADQDRGLAWRAV